jgi:hypothetical protein
MGLAKNIVYKNIFVNNVTFPIYVTQKSVVSYWSVDDAAYLGPAFSYFDQSQSPPPLSNISVNIDGLSFSNFVGTINWFHPGTHPSLSAPTRGY